MKTWRSARCLSHNGALTDNKCDAKVPAWPPHEGKSADREAAKVWGGEMAECHWLVSRITQRQSMGAPSGGESRRVLAKEALFHGRGYDYSPGFDLRRLLLRNPLVPLPPATPPSACCRSSPSPTVLPASLTPAFRKKLALRRHLMLFFLFQRMTNRRKA